MRTAYFYSIFMQWGSLCAPELDQPSLRPEKGIRAVRSQASWSRTDREFA